MPTYDNFLISFTTKANLPLVYEKNEFLRALNNGGTYNNEVYVLPTQIKQRTSGKDKIFYSHNNDTIQSIYILHEAINNSNLLYKDGVPNFILSQNNSLFYSQYASANNYGLVMKVPGDGTVPQNSTIVKDIDRLPSGTTSPSKKDATKHSFLMTFFRDTLLNFITTPLP
jgi:hypothetical protein